MSALLATVNWITALFIPCVVGVIAALVASWLATRRARNERLAALRLDAYRQLVVSAKGWSRGLQRSSAAEATGMDIDPLSLWEHHANKVLEQMDVLPFVEDPGALERIQASYEAMVDAVMSIDTDVPFEEQEDKVRAAPRAMQDFVTAVTIEARKEVRRL